MCAGLSLFDQHHAPVQWLVREWVTTLVQDCGLDMTSCEATNQTWASCRHITNAGPLGLTQVHLMAKLHHVDQQQQQLQPALMQPALECLLLDGTVQRAATFDQEVLVCTSSVDRLAIAFTGSLAEDAALASDFHSLAGLQAAGSWQRGSTNTLIESPAAMVVSGGAHTGRAEGKGLIRPWLNDRGKLNQPFWSSLTQRVMSVVMRNPGKLHSHRAELGFTTECMETAAAARLISKHSQLDEKVNAWP